MNAMAGAFGHGKVNSDTEQKRSWYFLVRATEREAELHKLHLMQMRALTCIREEIRVNFILQQDNCIIHVSKTVKEYM